MSPSLFHFTLNVNSAWGTTEVYSPPLPLFYSQLLLFKPSHHPPLFYSVSATLCCSLFSAEDRSSFYTPSPSSLFTFSNSCFFYIQYCQKPSLSLSVSLPLSLTHTHIHTSGDESPRKWLYKHRLSIDLCQTSSFTLVGAVYTHVHTKYNTDKHAVVYTSTR